MPVGAHEREAVGDVGAQADLLLLCALAEQTDDVTHDVVEVLVLDVQTELARLDARQIEQILHELLEALRVALDDVEEVRRGLGVALHREAERLRRGAHGRHRRAELVRDVRDEILPQRLEAADVGHVDEDREQAAGLAGERYGAHEQASRLEPAELDLGCLRRARLLRAPR